MERVSDQSPSTKNPSAPARPRPALRWTDPADVRTWLDAVRTELDDAAAYTREATTPRRKRTFTRRYLRRMLDGAMANLDALVGAADRGLTHGDEVTGDPG